MFIEVKTTVYISEADFMEMVDLCKDEKIQLTPEKAFWSVVGKWDDADYYLAGYAEEEAVKIIEKLLAGEKVNFK